MQRYNEIQEVLIKGNGKVWDDHHDGREITLAGLAALSKDGKITAVGLHDADHFSLNRVYLKDGVVHLSRDSVAGVLFPVNFNGDLLLTVVKYNEQQVNNEFSCGTLVKVMTLKPYPVTVINLSPDDVDPAHAATLARLGCEEALYSSKHFIREESISADPSMIRRGLLEDFFKSGTTVRGVSLAAKTDPKYQAMLDRLDRGETLTDEELEDVRQRLAKIVSFPSGEIKADPTVTSRVSEWAYGMTLNPMAHLHETIEDSIPPVSKAFHDEVSMKGGRFTMLGIVYDYPFVDAKEPVTGIYGFVITPPHQVLKTDKLERYYIDTHAKRVDHYGVDTVTNNPVKYTCTDKGNFLQRIELKQGLKSLNADFPWPDDLN